MPSVSVLSDDALEDFLEATRYLEWQTLGLGERFNLAFTQAVEMLLVFPDLGRDLGRYNVKRFGLHGFSYHLIYRVEAEVLVIYAVPHDKRRPGYWTPRLE